MHIETTTLRFLSDLIENNDRDWFNAHKHIYQEAQQNMCEFIEALIEEMNQHDLLENTSGKESLFRIYSDVRFKKDKSPYNPRFAFGLQRATKYRRGGYYVHIKPGESFIACGFFGPNPDDLKRIRTDIDHNYLHWQQLLEDPAIKATFGTMQGEKVKTAPQGYPKDHPAIELLRHKSFLFSINVKDDEVNSPGFLIRVSDSFKNIRPFFDYMSEVLTTNANGELIV
jgi:uncharacterized protein (TIGR02453 family)